MGLFAKQILCEISDKTFNPNYKPADIEGYRVREAARGILIHDDKIALLNVTKNKYHKLPGGGIEKNETKTQAFKREVLEEVGCKCSIKDTGPVVVEYRDKEKLIQISFIFLAKVEGGIEKPKYTQKEIGEGFQLKWVPIEQAEKIIEDDDPIGWEGKFIRLRDLTVFKYYRRRLSIV